MHDYVWSRSSLPCPPMSRAPDCRHQDNCGPKSLVFSQNWEGFHSLPLLGLHDVQEHIKRTWNCSNSYRFWRVFSFEIWSTVSFFELHPSKRTWFNSFPHVFPHSTKPGFTTVPSVNLAAKAPLVAQSSQTSTKQGTSDMKWCKSPQVTTTPSRLSAAKALKKKGKFGFRLKVEIKGNFFLRM